MITILILQLFHGIDFWFSNLSLTLDFIQIIYGYSQKIIQFSWRAWIWNQDNNYNFCGIRILWLTKQFFSLVFLSFLDARRRVQDFCSPDICFPDICSRTLVPLPQVWTFVPRTFVPGLLFPVGHLFPGQLFPGHLFPGHLFPGHLFPRHLLPIGYKFLRGHVSPRHLFPKRYKLHRFFPWSPFLSLTLVRNTQKHIPNRPNSQQTLVP